MTSDRIALALAVGLAVSPAGARAQTVREVRGSLMGIASGWVGAAVSIPYLKIGSLAGEHGTFRLKTTAPAGCYEMVLRGRGFRKTYYRFELPDSSLDLGAITLRPSHQRWLEPEPPEPEPIDTLGGCRPDYMEIPETWQTGRASLIGTVRRWAQPLRGAGFDLYCPDDLGTGRALSDSNGVVTYQLRLQFPQEQALANGGLAACQIRDFLPELDSILTVVVRFETSDAQPAAVTEFTWDLPDPTMVPSRVVAPAPYMTAAVRIPGIAALHLGVLSGQMIIFEIVPKPKDVTFTRQEVYPCPSLLRARFSWDLCPFAAGTPIPAGLLAPLPLAFRVAIGPKQAANGSSLLIALPSAFVANGNTLVKAYARLPRRLASHDDFYAPLMQYYDPLLRILHVELSPLAFADDRPSAGGNEAIIVLAVARPR